MIPERLQDWDLQTLNKLVTLKDIERESFDFKGPKLQDLSAHICAMANTAGGILC